MRNRDIPVDPVYNRAMPWWKEPIYGPELMGMRLLRKKSVGQMAKASKGEFDVEFIKYVENDNKVEVPPPLAGLYMQHLNCSMHHVYQFRDIMNGEKNDFNDSRYINAKLKKKVYEKYKSRCVVCKSGGDLHMHHVKEFAKGGTTDLNNLVLLCANCHADTHKDNRSYHMLKKIAGGKANE